MRLGARRSPDEVDLQRSRAIWASALNMVAVFVNIFCVASVMDLARYDIVTAEQAWQWWQMCTRCPEWGTTVIASLHGNIMPVNRILPDGHRIFNSWDSGHGEHQVNHKIEFHTNNASDTTDDRCEQHNYVRFKGWVDYFSPRPHVENAQVQGPASRYETHFGPGNAQVYPRLRKTDPLRERLDTVRYYSRLKNAWMKTRDAVLRERPLVNRGLDRAIKESCGRRGMLQEEHVGVHTRENDRRRHPPHLGGSTLLRRYPDDIDESTHYRVTLETGLEYKKMVFAMKMLAFAFSIQTDTFARDPDGEAQCHRLFCTGSHLCVLELVWFFC